MSPQANPQGECVPWYTTPPRTRRLPAETSSPASTPFWPLALVGALIAVGFFPAAAPRSSPESVAPAAPFAPPAPPSMTPPGPEPRAAAEFFKADRALTRGSAASPRGQEAADRALTRGTAPEPKEMPALADAPAPLPVAPMAEGPAPAAAAPELPWHMRQPRLRPLPPIYSNVPGVATTLPTVRLTGTLLQAAGKPAQSTIVATTPPAMPSGLLGLPEIQLSQAMEIGSTMKPQIFGGFLEDGGSCALGAAQDGAQAVNMRLALVPHSLTSMIIDMNDRYRIPREKIAAAVKALGF